tara:strand:- start:7 stop:213 length:207 start_codon:yes stop_codon:yes gene_type:complete
MASGDQILLAKIETLYECLAQQAEDGVEKINLLVSAVDVNKLSGDDRVKLQGWHEGAKRSAKTIRQSS